MARRETLPDGDEEGEGGGGERWGTRGEVYRQERKGWKRKEDEVEEAEPR